MTLFGGNLNLDPSIERLQMPPVQAAPAPPKKGGMFGSGIGLREALGTLLSAYSAGRGSPVGMMGLQMLQQKRQQALEESKYQQRRNDSFEDWVKQQAYKQANPDPSNPHYFESNSGDVYSILPGQQPQLQFKDPFRFKLVPNGMGGVVPVSIEQLMGGQGGQQLPQTLSDDDWPMQGGPTPQASGGFPRPF